MRYLALVVFFSFSVIVRAETWYDKETGYTWTYTIQDGNAIIENHPSYSAIDFYTCAISPYPKGVLFIPAELNGCKVTTIGKMAFFKCDSLSKVVVPPSVTSIGDNAFLACPALSCVEGADKVARIGKGAFSGCGNLREITIPDSVNYIGELAFCSCSNLTSVSIPMGVTNRCIDVFAKCYGVGEVTFPGDSELQYIFRDACANITNVVIHEGAVRIAALALNCCSNVTSVTIPTSVSEIGLAAFDGCSSLKRLELPQGLKEIPSHMCRGCNSLKSIDIPEGVTNIDTYAFGWCDGLERVVMPSSVGQVYAAFEGCHNVRDVTTALGVQMFPSFEKITNVVISAGATNVMGLAMCKGLMSVTIPNGVQCIEDGAFEGCSSLRKVTLPEGVKRIGCWAFGECNGLRTIVIPKSVIEIGQRAFAGCTQLRSIEIPNGMAEIGSEAFSGCSSLELIQTPLTSRMGWLFPDSYQTVSQVNVCDGVEPIDRYAFSGCAQLRKLHIPQGVTNFGERAFWRCQNLISLKVPSTVETVGEYAFDGCNELQWLSFAGAPPDGLENASINRDTLIMYNADFASQWRTVIQECGFTNAQPYIPSGHRACTKTNDNLNHVYMTITNIVVHYVQSATMTDLVIPISSDAGFVTVITEIKGGAIAIPSQWQDNYPQFGKFGLDFKNALLQPSGKVDYAGNKLFVWQDFVAGTDPTDVNDVFRASITMVDGEPIVSWSPILKPEQAVLRKYTIFGKKRLQDSEWQIVDGDAGKYNFFKVTVEMR